MSDDIVRQTDFGKDMGLVHEAVITGRKVGMTQDHWAKLAHNPKLFSRVISYIDESRPYTTIGEARETMRENMIGPEEIAKYLHIHLPAYEKWERIKNIPYSPLTLHLSESTHILVLGVYEDDDERKVDIKYLAKLMYGKPNSRSHEDLGWRELVKEPFFNAETCDFRWYLIRRYQLESGGLKALDDLLKAGAESQIYVEKAVVYYYAMALWKSMTDEELFEKAIITASKFTDPLHKINGSKQVVADKSILTVPFIQSSWQRDYADHLAPVVVRF